MPDLDEHSPLRGCRIVLGISGGIAAYKIPELVRLLRKAEADVHVLMTPDAARFVAPLTLAALSGHEVGDDLFSGNDDGSWTKHVDLGISSDLIVIAPATATTIARLAMGSADTLVSATVLAARAPVLVVPAMDHDMYLHPATQANLDRLRGFGYSVMQPGFGALASGLEGWGRMPEPPAIFERIVAGIAVRGGAAATTGERSESPASRLRGKTVLVTAGPTREAIDPVRFISNHSTGTMGFALASEAARRGADVVLVAGPTQLPTPHGVRRVDVESAADMHAAVQAHLDADVVIAAAAVADYAPSEHQPSKIKKTDPELQLSLRRTRDILAEIGALGRESQLRIGFALETDEEVANAQRKLREKNLHWIVANNAKRPGSGFGTTTNQVTLIGRDGFQEELPLMDKNALAAQLLDRMVERDRGPEPEAR